MMQIDVLIETNLAGKMTSISLLSDSLSATLKAQDFKKGAQTFLTFHSETGEEILVGVELQEAGIPVPVPPGPPTPVPGAGIETKPENRPVKTKPDKTETFNSDGDAK